MKKFIPALFTLAAALSASAETYYFDTQKFQTYNKDINLSESLSFDNAGTTDYLWYILDGGGAKVYQTVLPNFASTSDSFKFYPRDLSSSGKSVIVDTNFSGDTFAIGSNNMYVTSATDKDVVFNFKTIIGDGAQKNAVYGTNLSIVADTVKGNQYGDQVTLGSAEKSSIKSLKINDSWVISRGGDGNMTFYVTGVAGHSIYNADAYINKLTTVRRELDNTMLSYATIGTSANVNENSFANINEVSGNAGFWVAGATTSTGVLTVALTNNTSSDASSSGRILEGYRTAPDTYTTKDGGAKLAFVMFSSTKNGDGTYTYHNMGQSFTGDVITFTGGVQLISGKLRMNYSPALLGADVSHGTLKFSQANGANTSFGNANETVGGKFIFDNIVVEKGGSLLVRLDKSGETIAFDQIALSKGGITYAEGGSGNIVIDFGVNTGDYLADLIRTEASAGLKIIAFETTGFACEVTFGAVLSSFEKDGVSYNFTTFKDDSGIYAAYVAAIPEPAKLATIFGLLSLFAAYIRRK